MKKSISSTIRIIVVVQMHHLNLWVNQKVYSKKTQNKAHLQGKMTFLNLSKNLLENRMAITPKKDTCLVLLRWNHQSKIQKTD